ncbi:MAG: PLP-dependent aminotransferase family protein, partial [Chloroflexota bacterium]
MPQSNPSLPNTLYLSLVTIDLQAKVPLYRQIYNGLRSAIINDQLTAGTKLPSTRDLAKIWGVSRNTLRNAFDQLIAEGYLEAIVGKGTFVADAHDLLTSNSPVEVDREQERIRPISIIGKYLEPFGQALHQPPQYSSTDFAIGIPDYEAFPHKLWARMINRAQRRLQVDEGSRYNVRGMLKLRQAIASYLISARGVQCTAGQIDIIPGSSVGMMVATLALLNRGDKVWMENPGYISADGLFWYRGAEPCYIPIDEKGLNVQYGIEHAPDAKVAYVTPSHQYPLGITMTRERRHQLIDWAGRSNMWIFED